MCPTKTSTWKIFLSKTKAIVALVIPVIFISSGSFIPFKDVAEAAVTNRAVLTAETTADTWVVGKPFWEQAGVTVSVDPHEHSYTEGESLWVIVNKHRPLKPKNYKPSPLAKPDFVNKKQSNPLSYVLREDAAAALAKMDRAMMKAGAGRIILASGYRSYDSQTRVHASQVAALGKVDGERLAARPGYSEHQTGLAADLAALDTKGKSQGCYINVCFGKTKAGKWLRDNAYKYGYILRYEDEMTKVTGYQYEPWHFRFVGVELAQQYEDAGQQSYERFLGAPNAPNYFKNKKSKDPVRAWLY